MVFCSSTSLPTKVVKITRCIVMEELRLDVQSSSHDFVTTKEKRIQRMDFSARQLQTRRELGHVWFLDERNGNSDGLLD